MLKLTSRITIGDYSFNNCVEIEIHSGWEEMTDRCSITIPRKVKWLGKDLSAGDSPAIAVGDPVTVELGYDYNYSTYFTGYVTLISPKTPVVIECQDAVWFLKQASGSFTMGKGSTLEEIIEEIKTVYLASSVYAKYGVNITFEPVANTQIGSWRSKNVSMAFVLDSMKKKMGIVSFMRNGILYSGLAYYENQRNEVNRQFNWNIIDDNLEQKNATDIKVKLTVKAIDNKNLEPVSVGDGEGDCIDMLVSGVTTQAQMRERGEAELPKYKYNGFSGSFTTFGDEYIKHGEIINLSDPVIKDRNGKYFVKKVVTKFGTDGFRNTVELHKEL
jgi:hypothetical protein